MNKYIEDNPTRSRLAEILGVEEDEEWHATGNDVATYRIHGGHFEYSMSRPGKSKNWIPSDVCHLEDFIANPGHIIRKPRFSEADLVGMRWLAALGMTHIARDNMERMNLYAYSEKPCQREDRHGIFWRVPADDFHALPDKAFPAILPGQCVEIAEVLVSCSTK